MRTRLLLLAAGAFSLAAETLLFRETLAALHGNELGTGVFFGTWLAWVAVGATVGRAWTRRSTPSGRTLAWLALLYLPAVAAQLWGFHHLRDLAGVGSAEVFPLERLLALALVLNAPSSLITGLLFPVATAGEATDRTGALYAWEATGCFVGGAGFTLALQLGLGPLSIIGLAGAVLALAATTRATRVAALPAALAGLVLATAGGPALERWLAASELERLLPGAELLAAAETPSARLAVARRSDQVVVLRDGQVAASWPDLEGPALEVALAMAQAAGSGPPRRVLVLGAQPEEQVRALLRYASLERIDVLVPDPTARAFLDAHLPPALHRALEDARVVVRAADPRSALAQPGAGPWDLVMVVEGDPRTAAANRLITSEFYDQVQAVLAPGGVLTTHVVAGVNFMGPELAAQGGSVLRTLESVFEQVVVVPRDPARFYAGPTTTVDAEQLSARHRALRSSSPVPSGAFASLVEAERLAFVDEVYRRPDPTGGSLLNTDSRPVATTLALLVQGRFAGSGWVDLLHGARAVGAWLWWLPLGLVALVRAHRFCARPDESERGEWLAAWTVAGAGFSGLALGVVLLFAFQARVGTLFGQVGLLSAVLLAGTATGAALGTPLVAWLDPPESRSASRLPRTLLGVLLALAGFSTALPGVLASLPGGSAAEVPLLLLAALAGLGAGAAFPAAVGLAPRREERPGGLLFAADHLGGALGAVAVGVVALPLVGVTGACSLLVGVQVVLAALVLLRLAHARWVAPERGRRQRWTRAVRLWQRGLRSRPGFPFPRVGYALFALGLTAVLLGGLVARRLHQPQVHFERGELAAWGQAFTWEEQDRPFVHYQGRDGDPDLDEVLLASMAVRDDIHGYAGPLNLLVVVGADGRYRRLEVLESQETPSYLREVVQWLQGAVGRSVDDALALEDEGGDVDALTGATLSARAALATVNAAGGAVGTEVLGRPARSAEAAGLGVSVSPGALYLALALPLGIAVLLRGSLRLRSAFLLLNLVVGGVWLNAQVSLETLVVPLRSGLPPWRSPQAFLQVVGVATLTLLFGSAYCSVLCPFGALQEWLARLGQARRVSPRADRLARSVKYVLLTALLVGFAATGDRTLFAFDPLGTAFGGWPRIWPGAVLVFAVLGSLVTWRFWCRALCPLGALLSLANRIALGARWLPQRHYRRCDLGVEARQDLDCLQCNRCTVPVDALQVRGAVTPPALRTGPETWRSSAWLGAGVLLGVLLVLATCGVERVDPVDDRLGVVRDVDLEALERLIEQGRLSDHEAEFWRWAE